MAIISPEMVLSLQAIFVALLFVSMAFRMKSKFSIHVAIMILAVVVVLTGFTAVFALAYMNGESLVALSSPILFGIHGFFGGLALASGIVLVSLWRPHSQAFAVRSRRIWQITYISWLSAFLLGILLYMVLHTTLFV